MVESGGRGAAGSCGRCSLFNVPLRCCGGARCTTRPAADDGTGGATEGGRGPVGTRPALQAVARAVAAVRLHGRCH